MSGEENAPLKTQRPEGSLMVPVGVSSATGDSSSGTYRPKNDQVAAARPQAAPHDAQGPSLENGALLEFGELQYRVSKFLARSGEAEVFRVEAGDRSFAFKLYYQQFQPNADIVAELRVLNHPGVLRLIDCGYYAHRFYELSEYAAGGTLWDAAPIRDLTRLRDLTAQIVDGLHHCHGLRIIHRDIKPENIFFLDARQTRIALGDFGISSLLDKGFSRRFTGHRQTHAYAAPELFAAIDGLAAVGPEVDYYALGLTILALWDGRSRYRVCRTLPR